MLHGGCRIWRLLLDYSIDADCVEIITRTAIILNARTTASRLQRVNIVLVGIVCGHQQALLRIVEGRACCMLGFDHF